MARPSRDPDPKPQRGRPRCADTHRRILETALELAKTGGCGALTIEAIARECGVAKTTIYRRWPNVGALLTDAMLSSEACAAIHCEGDSTHDALVKHLKQTIRLFRSEFGARLAGVIGKGQLDSEVAREFRDRFLDPRRQEARAVLELAIRRGDLPAHSDLELALDLLFGPLYLRLLTACAPLRESSAEEIVKTVLAGLASRSR